MNETAKGARKKSHPFFPSHFIGDPIPNCGILHSTAGIDPKKEPLFSPQERVAREAGDEPAANGESGPLAGEDGTEELYDSPCGDWSTDSDAGRPPTVKLRVTAGAAAGASEDDDEGEKEAYLRSLPRPDSGRGPATVSSQSWSRRPISQPEPRAIGWSPWRLGRVRASARRESAQEEDGREGTGAASPRAVEPGWRMTIALSCRGGWIGEDFIEKKMGGGGERSGEISGVLV